MKYVAFLRAINVGGRNVIRMDALKSAFESRGFASVSTYVQSGNVLFASDEDTGSLTKRIETMLNEITGNEISAMLRSLDDLRQIIVLDPFADVEAEDSHRYVTFLRTPSDRELPGSTPRGDLCSASRQPRCTPSRTLWAGATGSRGPSSRLSSASELPRATGLWSGRLQSG